jgi:hypothetical protein
MVTSNPSGCRTIPERYNRSLFEAVVTALRDDQFILEAIRVVHSTVDEGAPRRTGLFFATLDPVAFT